MTPKSKTQIATELCTELTKKGRKSIYTQRQSIAKDGANIYTNWLPISSVILCSGLCNVSLSFVTCFVVH